MNYGWVIASPLSNVKPTISKQGSHFVNEGFGFMGGRETLKAVINIKTMLDRVKDILITIRMVLDMFLNCIRGTAGATCCPKGQNLPFKNSGLLVQLHPSPYKAQ